MKSRALAWIAAAIVAVLGIGWLALREEPASIVSPPAPDVSASAPASNPILDLAMPVPTTSTDVSTARAAIAPEVARKSAPKSSIPDFSEWLEGRVQFPSGTPSDERAVVSAVVPAINHNFHASQPERFDVDAEGRFRVRIPDRAWTLELDVEGRYLHTPVAQRVELDAVPDKIVLRPQLGACVRMHFVLTDRAVQRGVDPTRASVTGHSERSEIYFWIERMRVNPLDAANSFEVLGLDVEAPWQLTAGAPGSMSVRLDPLTLVAGEVREIDVVLDAGGRFSGIVRDEQGGPIESANVGFLTGIPGSTGPLGRPVHGRTDATGRFQIERDEPGEVRVWVGRDGYAARELGPWNVEAGTEVADLEVTLSGGLAITGSVRLPDGRAIRNARLSIDRVHATPGDPRRYIPIQANGTFQLQAVADDPLTLTVSVTVPVRTLLNGHRPPSVLWLGRAVGVRAPSAAVEIVLSRGESVRGRVVDDLGAPIAGASVLALPVGSEFGQSTRSSERSDQNGEFWVPSLVDGPWKIVARTGDSTFSEHVRIEMPRDAERRFSLVVTRPAVITGRVVDSHGATVGGARIELEAADDALARRTFLPSANSVGDGTFRVEGVPIGALRVLARRDGYARSASVDVVTATDATSAGVELVLRTGGSIDVIVFDAVGEPVASRLVQLTREGEFTPTANARTERDGRCRFEHVESGAVSVGGEWTIGRPTLAPVRVFVEDGEQASVVLRAPK